ncbi:MAG: hypothetical protein KBC33_02575 [Candidatus Pacebacteria bacterium]|nr:hypothetical protein [Candidatus Paceibacterota bacterium]
MIQRIKGYVVAYDNKSGKLVWVVKVKDPSSTHNDQKFEVASLHPGTMLEKPGIDVTFRVEDFGSQREKVLKAVDVSIGKENPEAKPIKERTFKSLNFAFTREGDQLMVWKSECSSQDEAQEMYRDEHQQDAVLGLIKITPQAVLAHGGAISDEEAVAGLVAVRAMAELDGIRDVLCAIAAEAFQVGKRQP